MKLFKTLLEEDKFRFLKKYIFKLQDALEEEYESLDITTSAKIYEECKLIQSNGIVVKFCGGALHITSQLVDFYIDLVIYDDHPNIISHYGRTNRFPFEKLLGIDFNIEYPDFGPKDVIFELNHQSFKIDNISNNFLWFNKLNHDNDIIFKNYSKSIDRLYKFNVNHKKLAFCSFYKSDEGYIFELNNDKFKTIKEFNKIRDNL